MFYIISLFACSYEENFVLKCHEEDSNVYQVAICDTVEVSPMGMKYCRKDHNPQFVADRKTICSVKHGYSETNLYQYAMPRPSTMSDAEYIKLQKAKLEAAVDSGKLSRDYLYAAKQFTKDDWDKYAWMYDPDFQRLDEQETLFADRQYESMRR